MDNPFRPAPRAVTATGPTLRLVLATFGLVVCTGAAVAFAILEVPTTIVAVTILLAVVAAVDIVVIIRRKHRDTSG